MDKKFKSVISPVEIGKSAIILAQDGETLLKTSVVQNYEHSVFTNEWTIWTKNSVYRNFDPECNKTA